jgi:hypothetical protein
MLTPKFGTGRSLICGPSLVSGRRKVSLKDSAEELAVGNMLPFGKGTVCADLQDCVMTCPERKGRMDG